MRRAGFLVAAALVATLAVPIVLGGRDAFRDALQLPVQDYLVLLAVIAVSWFARAVKIYWLLHRLNVGAGYWHVFLISLATDFGFISTPGGVGGYAAGIFYVRRAGATTSGAATVTAADQLLDWTFFATALPIAGLGLLHADMPAALAWLAFTTSALMIGFALVALIARRKVVQWLCDENAISRRWPRLRKRQHLLREFFISLRDHSSVLLNGGPLFLLGMLLLSALQWFSRYGVLWVALLLLGHSVPFALTLLLQGLVLHAAMWTGMPSGGGGAEIGLSAALAAWVPATSIATALLLWRVATMYLCLAAGAIAIALLARLHSPAASGDANEPVEGAL